MKKFFVLLVAACCLFVSCEKESGNSSLDGSTWKSNDGYTLELKSGYASYYEGTKLIDTQAYTINGNKLLFKSPLHLSYSPMDYISDEGSFNEDYSKLTLIVRFSVGWPDKKYVYYRVAQ